MKTEVFDAFQNGAIQKENLKGGFEFILRPEGSKRFRIPSGFAIRALTWV